ncbi:peptidoglycan DD-metalloendopeptidase family protein [Streptomyces pactum]|uniref:Peptidoglycan DD-metalloendopeptidase family protein n=1 Tax=Streptomyces pactum TaxID=68249 RepID=A0ABS0NS69_9ACTN|nr:M23 family metallopeptidase [Streptomyces pactum]MBH5338055.1 peptidoglycan DD-metalloendopeptidase family protein [Streptomyces pactum]
MRQLRVVLVGLAAIVAGLLFAPPAHAAPNFKAPYPCGQTWTYSHHSAEVRQALDFVRSDGGATAGTPVLASAGGTAYRYYEAGGAGNYVVVDHGGGWKTYYFHLASFTVAHGQGVSQGQQIGTTGSTGNSSGAHIHYEQLYNGVGQSIRINGQSLTPYPGSYHQKYLTSDNGCAGQGRYWVDTFADAPGHASPTSTTRTGTLYAGTNYVFCKAWGREIRDAQGNYNHWWLKTDLDVGPAGQWVSAYYLSRWGNDEARDNNGAVIPTC